VDKGSGAGRRLRIFYSNQVFGSLVELRKQAVLKMPCSLDVEEVVEGSTRKTPPYRSKMKGLSELGEPNTHLRRSVRLSVRLSQVRKEMTPRAGSLTSSISDRDINNCNARVRNPRIREEPTNLWNLGKQIGLACRREEEEVVQEFQCVEERDLEFMKCLEVDNLNGFLC